MLLTEKSRNYWKGRGRHSISVHLPRRDRCFSRVCAKLAQSIRLDSKINELKAIANDTNKAKINNVMIFQYVWKRSLYKIASSCYLQTVIVQSRNNYLHRVTYACSNRKDAVNTVTDTAEALHQLYISYRFYKFI